MPIIPFISSSSALLGYASALKVIALAAGSVLALLLFLKLIIYLLSLLEKPWTEAGRRRVLEREAQKAETVEHYRKSQQGARFPGASFRTPSL